MAGLWCRKWLCDGLPVFYTKSRPYQSQSPIIFLLSFFPVQLFFEDHKMAGGKKLSKEDELLLQNFSRSVSTKSSVLFYANALVVSAIPLCKSPSSSYFIDLCYVHVALRKISNLQLVLGLFWRIHQMDPYSSGILFVVMTLVSTWLVSFAYKNVKFQLKHK